MYASLGERNPRAQRKRNGREGGRDPFRIAGRSPAGGVESERS
jgi:hypothetical protein